MRLWQVPVKEILAGGLGVLPLAPLANLASGKLPALVRSMDERLRSETDGADRNDLWSAAFVLMGLRYDPEVTMQVLRGVSSMKESSTYQAILEEGAVIGEARGEANAARDILLHLGTKRFGMPTTAALKTITAMDSADRLKLLCERVIEVESWKELLAR